MMRTLALLLSLLIAWPSVAQASYISFTLLTNTPAQVRTFLINRGILENVPGVVFAREGGEYVEVPNPIVITPDSNPADLIDDSVRDTRRVFLIKVARAAKADEENGEALNDAQGNPRPLTIRTKLGKWVMANSVSDPITGFHNGVPVSYPARRVGANTWLTLQTLGEWQ